MLDKTVLLCNEDWEQCAKEPGRGIGIFLAGAIPVTNECILCVYYNTLFLIKVGTILDCKIEVDFGEFNPYIIQDPRPDKQNVTHNVEADQESFAASWVYKKAGTHTITVKITDLAGNVYKGSRDIIIPEFSKTIKEITPHDDLDAAINSCAANTHIILKPGLYMHKIESPIRVKSRTLITCDTNVLVESLSNGSTDRSVFHIGASCVVENMPVRCTKRQQSIFEFTFTSNSALVGCKGYHTQNFISITDGNENLFLLNCESHDMSRYGLAGQNNDHTVMIGGYHGPIDKATLCRSVGAEFPSQDIIYAWIHFDSPRGEEAIRFQHNDWAQAYGCFFDGPAVGFGHDEEHAQHTKFDKNYCRLTEGDFIIMMKGMKRVLVINNKLELTPSPRYPLMFAERDGPTDSELFEDVLIAHNDLIINPGCQVNKIIKKLESGDVKKNVRFFANRFILSQEWKNSPREVFFEHLFANEYRWNVYPKLSGGDRYGLMTQQEFLQKYPDEILEGEEIKLVPDRIVVDDYHGIIRPMKNNMPGAMQVMQP